MQRERNHRKLLRNDHSPRQRPEHHTSRLACACSCHQLGEYLYCILKLWSIVMTRVKVLLTDITVDTAPSLGAVTMAIVHAITVETVVLHGALEGALSGERVAELRTATSIAGNKLAVDAVIATQAHCRRGSRSEETCTMSTLSLFTIKQLATTPVTCISSNLKLLCFKPTIGPSYHTGRESEDHLKIWP